LWGALARVQEQWLVENVGIRHETHLLTVFNNVIAFFKLDLLE
jgi:hypothetical protein